MSIKAHTPHPFEASKESGRFLYEEVADALAAQISAGNYKEGERCPSVRQVCKQFQVSLSTAVQALTSLERRGLVEARPQSGFYVRRPLEPAWQLPSLSPTSRVAASLVETSHLINEVVAAARDPACIPFGAATVHHKLIPAAALHKSLLACSRELGGRGHDYELPPGNEDLRRQIARRALTAGVKVRTDEVLITVGGMEAINLCLRAVAKAGDTVAVESPMFYGIIDALNNLGLKAAEIPADPVTGLDLDCLSKLIRSRRVAAVIVIANFNNPLGSKMPDESKRAIVRLLDEHDIPLIEDDVYGDLQHDGGRPITCKAFDRNGLVMLCSSFTKTLSPGMRIGWILPGRYLSKLSNLKFTNTIATPTLPQAAIAHFLGRGAYDRHLRTLRANLRVQIHQYCRAVSRYFPTGTRISQPEGGFVLWIELPLNVDAEELFRAAFRRKISIVPGNAFSASPERFRNFIRITCGHPFDERIEAGLKQLGKEAAMLAAMPSR